MVPSSRDTDYRTTQRRTAPCHGRERNPTVFGLWNYLGSGVTEIGNREICRAPVSPPQTRQGGLLGSTGMAVTIPWGCPRCSDAREQTRKGTLLNYKKGRPHRIVTLYRENPACATSDQGTTLNLCRPVAGTKSYGSIDKEGRASQLVLPEAPTSPHAQALARDLCAYVERMMRS